MTILNSDSTPAVRPDLTAVEVDGELVIYDDSRRRLHRLNPSATILWNCLDGSATLREIADDIAEALAANPTSVLSDIVALAVHLDEEGLLQASEQPPEAGEPPTGSLEPNPPNEGHSFASPAAGTSPIGGDSSMTIRVGSNLVGLRLSTPALEMAARAVFGPSIVETGTTPANVSVVEASARAGSPVYWCYISRRLVARARGVQGALRTVAALLSTFTDAEATDGTVLIEATVATRDGDAVLVCPESRFWAPGLSARLRMEGWDVHDSPWVHLDVTTSEVVVEPAAVVVDEVALAALTAHRLDGRRVPTGRYPVRAWVAPPLQIVDTSSPAGQLVGVAAESPDLHRNAAAVFRAALNLVSRAAWRVAASLDLGSFARLVTA